MSELSACNQSDSSEARLPRRDWILLPLLSLLTISFISVSVELIARKVFSTSQKQAEDCMVYKGPSLGIRGIPGCVCWEKIGESQPVEYRFNSGGYRAQADFEPKKPGIFRIVMVGSSYGMGARVSIEDSLSTRLEPEISSLTGRKIEIYNQSLVGRAGSPESVALRFDDALAVKPDLILWTITAHDLTWPIQEDFKRPQTTLGRQASGPTVRGVKEAVANKSIVEVLSSILRIKSRFIDTFVNTDSGVMLRHFLDESQYQCIASMLHESDRNSGFLKADLSAAWQGRLRESAKSIAEIERSAKAAKVPTVVVLLPTRAHAAMIWMGTWPAGYDPYNFDTQMRFIIENTGGTYIDVLPGFRTIPDPEQYYFPADGHLKPAGNAILAHLVAKELTTGVIPTLKAGNLQQVALIPGR